MRVPSGIGMNPEVNAARSVVSDGIGRQSAKGLACARALAPGRSARNAGNRMRTGFTSHSPV
jgi:hypothetical protein